jgi:NAD(P)-dependent dehydrogenase (short-subunit alcohol dehydrogenase family)
MDMRGKTALVTGGAHRVGKAITLMLAQAGADVALTYRTSGPEAQQTVAEAEMLGVRALAIRCDVSQWADVQAMAQSIQDHFGGVDIIVNSAGYFRRTPIPTQDMEPWTRITRASIDGVFFVCNSLAPSMLQRGAGVIVNILDLSAWHPWTNYAAHSVAKAGMLALTRQFAVELSPTIRTNAVAAGPVLPPADMDAGRRDEIASMTLLNRWGDPADVADAVRFLIEADYVIGEILTVDGGERYRYAQMIRDPA